MITLNHLISKSSPVPFDLLLNVPRSDSPILDIIFAQPYKRRRELLLVTVVTDQIHNQYCSLKRSG